MAEVKILGGDIEEGKWFVAPSGDLRLTYLDGGKAKSFDQKISLKAIFFPPKITLKGQIERVEQVTEDNAKKLGSAAVWGAAGAVLFGPLGALAGFLAGGNSKDIAFACYLRDGRKFMGVTDPKTFQRFSMEVF